MELDSEGEGWRGLARAGEGWRGLARAGEGWRGLARQAGSWWVQVSEANLIQLLRNQ